MYAMSSGDESDTKHIPKDMLEDINDRIKSHPSIIMLDTWYSQKCKYVATFSVQKFCLAKHTL